MSTAFRGTPGTANGGTIVQRIVFTNPSQVEYASTNSFIDGSLTSDTGSTPAGLLRAGLLLGKITATGKLRNSIIGTTGAITASGTLTTVPTTAAVANEVARLIAVTGGNVTLKLVGPPAGAGTVATTTVTATAASGTSITITSANVPAYIAGSFITPADGSEVLLIPLVSQYGLSVVDEVSLARIDQPLRFHPRKGDINVKAVVNYPTDPSLRAWLKAQLKAANPMYSFTDER